MDKQAVLVMYDIRGIQDYIFRTSKMKDAIGASAIVEGIFEDTLEKAITIIRKDRDITGLLTWNDDRNLETYSDEEDVVVLYIGGGNAVIRVSDRELALRINRIMARETIERTYSLQLACAMVDVTGNYAEDYRKLNTEMTRTKETMAESKPFGALPVMRIENKTGYPVTCESDMDESRETLVKKRAGEKQRSGVNKNMKLIDNYVTEKGVDSTVAIVHIDGNNMGLRIRRLLENVVDYQTAVPLMRRVSYNINKGYKETFEEMADYFNNQVGKHVAYQGKSLKNCFVSRVLVAGDDITYICNGKIALATVQFFAESISGKYLVNKLDIPENGKPEDYKFSVCGGIAYISSHFPFHSGYDVAESCCDSAKKRAKQKENLREGRVGNWVDFHICRNVQSKNLKKVRITEYITPEGEHLLRRPYRFEDPSSGMPEVRTAGTTKSDDLFRFRSFHEAVTYFQRSGNWPRSQVKQMRNTYPLGGREMDRLMAFLSSRGRKLPGDQVTNRENAYYVSKDENKTYAKYYDALEMSDLYIGLDEIREIANQSGRR